MMKTMRGKQCRKSAEILSFCFFYIPIMNQQRNSFQTVYNMTIFGKLDFFDLEAGQDMTSSLI